MNMNELIKKKRDGGALNEAEIKAFVEAVTDGSIPDYQISAFLMAIFFRGLNKDETVLLTKYMMHSGDIVDLSMIEGIKVDKHSTGGVGDSVSLVCNPIAASLGVKVAKFSGRGLGHTGGTVDKLESIPGFNASLSSEDFIKNVVEIGFALSGQSHNLCPADKKLYALRDVTSTIEQTGLIASSIMSKKLASGADAIVLDVKQGNGAFMKTEEEARELAKTLTEIGTGIGRKVAAFISDMSQPLGYSVGNSLEVIEAIEILKGRGPEDKKRLSLEIAREMVYFAKQKEGYTREEITAMVNESVSSGKALAKFAELIERQGGNPEVIENYELFKKPKYERVVVSDKDGYVSAFDTESIGIIAMKLGAGRETVSDVIDMSAGLILNKKIGDEIKKGEALATLFSDNEDAFEAACAMLKAAITVSGDRPQAVTLIKDVIYA